jgi:hypothetical protein
MVPLRGWLNPCVFRQCAKALLEFSGYIGCPVIMTLMRIRVDRDEAVSGR